MAYHERDRAKQDYAAFKAAVTEAGRDPDLVKVTMAAYPIVAETRAEAEDRLALAEHLSRDIDRLSLLSEVLNFDFASKGMDESFLGRRACRHLRNAGDTRPCGAAQRQKEPHGARLHRGQRPRHIHDHPVFPGAPKDVADQMEQWFAEPACDGFVIAAAHVPGAYEEFVRLVVPELQRRGLHQTEYAGATLRENLGMPRPAIGAWRAAGR